MSQTDRPDSRRPPHLLAASLTCGVVLLLATGLFALGGAPGYGLWVGGFVPFIYGIYLLVRRRPKWGIGLVLGSMLAGLVGLLLTPPPPAKVSADPATPAPSTSAPSTSAPASSAPPTSPPATSVAPTPAPPTTAPPKSDDGSGEVPWTKVTNGSWEYGDVGYGNPVEARLSDFRIRVTGKPTMTTADGGRTITIASPISVKKVRDRGFNTGDTPIGESEQFIFMPGPASTDLNEDYGEATVVDIKTPEKVGQATKGTVSFTAPADEIQDCYWMINRMTVAAWPGQKA